MNLFLPILFFLVLGVAAGVVLTAASRVFTVKTDEKVDAIMALLPGANCGGCGFTGCEGYAKALAAGTVPATACKPGGNDTALKLSEILGVEVSASVPSSARVACGGCTTGTKLIFDGTQSCAAAMRYYAGSSFCEYGCLGYGDCAAVCPGGGIDMSQGFAVVNADKCTSCGLCVKTCPKHLITVSPLVTGSGKNIPPVGLLPLVNCNSADFGKAVKDVCAHGCIGCGMCAKKCPSDAIKMEGKLARIIPDKCTACGTCVSVCPTKAIRL